MKKRIARVIASTTLAASLSILSIGALCAQDKADAHGKKAAETPSLTGNWNMSLQGDHAIPAGVTLEQDGKKITGTMMFMGKDIKLEGEFVDGSLTLTSNAAFLLGPPPDSQSGHGAGALHGSSSDAPPAKMRIIAKLKDDGTFAGEITTSRGSLPMSAERFRQRQVRSQKDPKAAASDAAGSIAGDWTVSVARPQGEIKLDVAFKQNGEKVTGTLSSSHTGEMAFEGTFSNNTLTFATKTHGGGQGAMNVEYSAKLKDDGTLDGSLSTPAGKMAWTGERVKK